MNDATRNDAPIAMRDLLEVFMPVVSHKPARRGKLQIPASKSYPNSKESLPSPSSNAEKHCGRWIGCLEFDDTFGSLTATGHPRRTFLEKQGLPSATEQMKEASQHETAPASGSVAQQGVQLCLSRRAIAVLMLALVAPWAAVLALLAGFGIVEELGNPQPRKGSFARPQVTRGRSGPWGELQYTRIAIEPPEYFVVLPQQPQMPRWFFKGVNRQQLAAFLQTLPLTEIQQVSLTQATTWTETKEGIWLAPPPELVLGLSQQARARIYDLLALIPENQMMTKVFSFNPDYLDERLKASDLRRESLELFRGLLYWQGRRLLFADADVVLPRLPDDTERRRFLKMLARKNTMLAKLLITPETNVEELVEYWAVGGRAKDLGPLLESLRRVRGGTELGIAQLLPSFARRRLYTYPDPEGGPKLLRKNDLWALLNFFQWTPDDRYADMTVASEEVKKEYYEIAGNSRLGDMVALVAADNRMISSTIYIADDIVFGRPGPLPTEPWLLVTINDWMSLWTSFFSPDRPLSVRIYRRK